MNLFYKVLFKVHLFHNYYKSGISDDFTVLPSPDCKKVLNRFGLLFRQTRMGFSILYGLNDNKNTVELAKPLDSDFIISFYLKAKNNILLNYSQLPIKDTNSKVYYLNNLSENIINTELSLTSSPYLSANDQIEIRPKKFTYTFNSTESSVLLEIIDEMNQTIRTQSVEIVEGQGNCFINLDGFPDGKYLLKVNNRTELFYSSDIAGVEKIFAVIGIFNNGSVPAAYQFINGSAVNKKEYYIKIDNRKTYWKYVIGLKYKKEINPETLILENFTRQPHQSEEIVTVPFISDNEMEIKEQITKGITLKSTNGNGSEIIYYENLPNANPEILAPDLNDSKIFSEIFVYI